MKVVHLSTYGPVGGAGRAAYTLHTSLVKFGCDSWMLVAQAADPTQRILPVFGQSFTQRVRTSLAYRRQTKMQKELHPKESFYPDRFGTAEVGDLAFPVTPDIIHLHWIGGFLTSKDIRNLWNKYQVPFVWTVMDMAPLTGGCHYSHGCQGFTQQCGKCPILDSNNFNDISHQSWLSKSKNLHDIPITLVGATQWVEDRAKASSLFSETRFVQIPYGKDTNVFRPASRKVIREALRLPLDAQIIFFGTARHNDPRKGISYLIEAFEALYKRMAKAHPPVIVLTAGETDPEQLDRIPFPRHELGSLNDDRLLAMAYQAADVFVCPSVDDAGPLMLSESLLCGTPIVAFEGCGGAPDYIRSGQNGYLAEMRNSADLAQCIEKTLAGVATGEITSDVCSQLTVRGCTLEAQATRYLDLYQELLTEKKDSNGANTNSV